MSDLQPDDPDVIEDEPLEKPKPPVVSVVMPAYNTERFIGEAIRSVVRQTYTDWELLVIDDGSTDDTPRVVADMMESRIRYIHTENMGAGSARNLGIEKARGDFVAFLDSDDVWFPHKLAVQVDVLRRDPETGLTYSNLWYVNERGKRIGMPRFALERLPDGWCLDKLLVRNGVIGGGSTVMVRRLLLHRVGPFDTSLLMGQDWDLWLRLATCSKFRYTPQALMAYRQRRGSISTAGVLRSLFDYMIVERAFAREDVREKFSPWQIAAIKREAEALRYYNAGSRLLRNGQPRLAAKSFVKSCRAAFFNVRQLIMLAVSLAAGLPFVDRKLLLKATKK